MCFDPSNVFFLRVIPVHWTVVWYIQNPSVFRITLKIYLECDCPEDSPCYTNEFSTLTQQHRQIQLHWMLWLQPRRYCAQHDTGIHWSILMGSAAWCASGWNCFSPCLRWCCLQKTLRSFPTGFCDRPNSRWFPGKASQPCFHLINTCPTSWPLHALGSHRIFTLSGDSSFWDRYRLNHQLQVNTGRFS